MVAVVAVVAAVAALVIAAAALAAGVVVKIHVVDVSDVLVDASTVAETVQEVALVIVQEVAHIIAIMDAPTIVRLAVTIHVTAHALGCVQIIAIIAIQDNKVAIFCILSTCAVKPLSLNIRNIKTTIANRVRKRERYLL